MLEALARAPFGDLSKQLSTTPSNPKEDDSSSSSEAADEEDAQGFS